MKHSNITKISLAVAAPQHPSENGSLPCVGPAEDPTHPAWQEYDNAAEDTAKRGLSGAIGTPLPENMTPEAVGLINDDPDAFARRVRECAYAQAMERHATEQPNHQPPSRNIREAIASPDASPGYIASPGQ